MFKCVKDYCEKDPLMSPKKVLFSCDGDFACCPECYKKAVEQRDYFFETILTDDKLFSSWMGVSEEWVKNK